MNRRDLLSKAGAAGVLLAGAGAALKTDLVSAATGAESSKLFLPPDRLAPATFDRLPLSWHKERFRILQGRLEQAGYDGILLTDQWNIIYFTGLFHTNTERPFYAFIPTKGEHPVWFFPALDRDLVRSWWYEDGDMYFDYPNVAGCHAQRRQGGQGTAAGPVALDVPGPEAARLRETRSSPPTRNSCRRCRRSWSRN